MLIRSEIVVFGLLICRLQRSGLALCSTDMSDHVLGSWKVNCGGARPQFPHNRVPLGGLEIDGWAAYGPFPVCCF